MRSVPRIAVVNAMSGPLATVDIDHESGFLVMKLDASRKDAFSDHGLSTFLTASASSAVKSHLPLVGFG